MPKIIQQNQYTKECDLHLNFTQLSIGLTMTHPIFCVPATVLSFGTISFLDILLAFTKCIRYQ